MKKTFIFIFSFFLFFSCLKQGEINMYVKKGLQAYSHQNLDKAIYYFSFAAKRGKEKETSLIMLGKSYYYKGDKKLAKKTFHKLLRRNKYSIDALIWLTRLEGIDVKQYDKGLQYCNQVLRLDSDNYKAYFYRGIIREELKKTKLAIEDYTSALGLENIIFMSHYQLGLLYLNKGVIEKGVKELYKSLLYAPDSTVKKTIKEQIKKYEK